MSMNRRLLGMGCGVVGICLTLCALLPIGGPALAHKEQHLVSIEVTNYLASGKNYSCKRTKSKVPLESIVTKKGPKDVRKEIDRLWNEVSCEWAEMKRRAFTYNVSRNPSKDEPPLRKAHDLVVQYLEDLGIFADKYPQAVKGEFLATVVKMGERGKLCRQENRVGLGSGWCWYLDQL